MRIKLNSLSAIQAHNLLRSKGMSYKGAEYFSLKYCSNSNDLKRQLTFSQYAR